MAWPVIVVAAATMLWSALSTSADGYTGTREAKRLARQMLEFYKHVQFVSVSYSGDVYYCPQFHNGYLIGPRGPARYPTCTARASVTEVEQLSGGRMQLIVGEVAAKGKPTLTYVARHDGRYVLDPSRGCWRKNLPALPNEPAISFRKNERLTIVGRRHGYTLLKGTIPHDVVEVNRINSRTHELRSDRVVTSNPRSDSKAVLRTVPSGPAVPDVNPLCS